MTDKDQVLEESKAKITDTPGHVLRLEREKRGWSQRDVADKLCLLVTQINDLETDCYYKFRAEIFSKGYLVRYAQLLAVDEQPLLEIYSLLVAKDRVKKIQSTPKYNRSDLVPKIKKNKFPLGLCAVLLVIIILWIWQSTSKHSVEETIPTQDAALGSISQSDNVLSENIIEVEVTKNVLLVEQSEVPVISEDGLSVPLNTDQITVIGEESVAADNAEHRLDIRFNGDCWISITDGNNKRLISDLKHADDVVTLQGVPPFKVVLGYAPAAIVNYNGQPVNITVNPQDKSAKLTIGES